MNERTLLDMYRKMLRIRLAEERIAERYDENEMKCPTHLSVGQEAVAVGVCQHLNDSDVIYSTHRCHAHYLAKGGDLNRMIAEMYGKEAGCAKGRGGSMHLIDVERGMYGASAIVGGSLPLPVGAALAFRLWEDDTRYLWRFRGLEPGDGFIAVAFFGDAGIEPGVFHECMNFAALRKLPVVFVCENNDYSTMTRRDERQRVPIAERAAGYGMRGIRVDGNDVVAVYETAQEAIRHALCDNEPTLIEAVTYRWREHVEHNKGIMSRPMDELRHWKARDPLERCRKDLESYGIPADVIDTMRREIVSEIDEAFHFAKTSPSPNAHEFIRDVGDEVQPIPEPALPRGERKITCAQAIAEATVQAMEIDPTIFVFGLHVTDPNGVFGTTKPAFDRFGHERVFETPICEPSMIGVATGAAMQGMRPLHVNARNDFLLLCMDQIGNELSKWHYMSGGQLRAPVVIRAIVGRSRGQGCQHSQSLQSVFAHFPGLHVVAPSNAYDAKGLLMTALSGRAPVIYLEHRLCHPVETAVPEESYRIPIGKAAVRREGTDVTIVSILQMTYEAQAAANELAKHGISAEVIDLRSIRPWDVEAVCASVRKTGRLIVADTGWIEFGISAEISATVTERCFDRLKAAPSRVANPACPTPMAEPLETAFYPGSFDIMVEAFRMLGREIPRGLKDGFALNDIAGPF